VTHRVRRWGEEKLFGAYIEVCKPSQTHLYIPKLNRHAQCFVKYKAFMRNKYVNIVYDQGHGRVAVKSFTCAPVESFTCAIRVGILLLRFHSFPLKLFLKAGGGL